MTNNCLIPEGRAIIVNFPAGAGGKMIQNCIGLSRHCVLSKLEYAIWQLKYRGPFNENFYRKKLAWIMNTLPEEENLKHWLGYEFGETGIYGINWKGFQQLNPVPNQQIYELGKNGLWSTITIHNYGSAKYYQHYWPTIKYISLVNNKKFARKALAVKNPELIFDEDWDTGGCCPKGESFEFDVDYAMNRTDLFVYQMRRMYTYLEFDDYKPELIAKFHEAYIRLHKNI